MNLLPKTLGQTWKAGGVQIIVEYESEENHSEWHIGMGADRALNLYSETLQKDVFFWIWNLTDHKTCFCYPKDKMIDDEFMKTVSPSPEDVCNCVVLFLFLMQFFLSFDSQGV